MKKTIVLFLTIIMLLSGIALLSSCDHECTVSSDWSHDDNHHWRACEVENCTKTPNKATHTWDEGKITTAPTREAAGVKTYTCTLCAHTKTEEIPYVAHDCAFSTNWSHDNANHWHACETKGDCTEAADKAAHTWNEGKITTEPTHETVGTKTYTCTVCTRTKAEEIPPIDQCIPAADWSHDATDHWHVCAVKNCTQVLDKTAHAWNEGEITTKPTQEAAGVKTFTCTVCSDTKTEEAAFTGLTKADWDAVINTDLFDNYTFSMTITAHASGVQATTSLIYKVADDKILLITTLSGQTQEQILDDNIAETKLRMAKDLVEMFKHSYFTYDTEAKLYRANGKISIPIDGSEPTNATLRFENGKPVELTYSYVVEYGVTVDTTILFSDYGTTVVSKQPVSSTGMTEEEWNAAISPSTFDNYTLSMTVTAHANGAQATALLICKVADDKILMTTITGGQTQEQIVDEGVAEEKREMAEDLVAMFQYANFTYDAEANLYRAKGKISIPIDDSEPTNATLRFENGKPVMLTYSYVVENGVTMDTIIIFSDYGTTVVSDSQDSSGGMTEEEWDAAIAPSTFDNYTLSMTVTGSANGVQSTASQIYKVADDKIHYTLKADGMKFEQTVNEGVAEAKQEMAEDLIAMFQYGNFTYDAEANLYRAKATISIPIDGSEPTNATLRFEDGKPVEMTYSYVVVEEGVAVTIFTTITFSDYGTTVVSD